MPFWFCQCFLFFFFFFLPHLICHFNNTISSIVLFKLGVFSNTTLAGYLGPLGLGSSRPGEPCRWSPTGTFASGARKVHQGPLDVLCTRVMGHTWWSRAPDSQQNTAHGSLSALPFFTMKRRLQGICIIDCDAATLNAIFAYYSTLGPADVTTINTLPSLTHDSLFDVVLYRRRKNKFVYIVLLLGIGLFFYVRAFVVAMWAEIWSVTLFSFCPMWNCRMFVCSIAYYIRIRQHPQRPTTATRGRVFFDNGTLIVHNMF